MSKRLQVIMSDAEFDAFRQIAARRKLALGEWVRRAMRRAAEEEPVKTAEEKIRALRKAAQYSFPTGDIDQINREIEEGYQAGLP